MAQGGDSGVREDAPSYQGNTLSLQEEVSDEYTEQLEQLQRWSDLKEWKRALKFSSVFSAVVLIVVVGVCVVTTNPQQVSDECFEKSLQELPQLTKLVTYDIHVHPITKVPASKKQFYLTFNHLEKEINDLKVKAARVSKMPGPVGKRGPIGPRGRRGLTGPKGRRGPTGHTGRHGRRGRTGAPGRRGRPGRPGHNGRNGKPGIPGQPGSDGRPGSPGRPGPRGFTGKRGRPGHTGATGRKGAPGRRGRDGRNGRNGAPGHNGHTGPPGKPGPRGAPGVPGKIKIIQATPAPTSAPLHVQQSTDLFANIALEKHASQSTTAYGGVASRAVDGNINGYFPGKSVTHTSFSRAWWKVDLGANYKLWRISIYNRVDCCASRLKNFDVDIIDSRGHRAWKHYVHHVNGVKVILVPDVVGQYIKIQRLSKGYLSLAEVKVRAHGPKKPLPMGTVKSMYTNIAKGKGVLQTCTAYGGNPARAVDGNTNGNWGKASTTHTCYVSKPWWRVDLGANYPIWRIRVYNRQDCCHSRLSNFDVSIIDSHEKVAWKKFAAKLHGPHITFKPHKAVGRFVRVQLRGKNYLSLAEVTVNAAGPKPSLNVRTASSKYTNVAHGKHATQSSVAYGGRPSRAVDGNTSGQWSARSVTHTTRMRGAWWEVNLAANYKVRLIKIFNRVDCCQSRLKNFDVVLTTSLHEETYRHHVDKLTADSLELTVPDAVAQHVRVQLVGTDYLSLAEVQVFAEGADKKIVWKKAPSPFTDIAKGKTATQSSVAYGGVPARAVDGNTSGMWGQRSTTHTARDNHAWWKVDLGADYKVRKIVVWSRVDCCKSRLTNFDVTLQNSHGDEAFKHYVHKIAGDHKEIKVPSRVGQTVKVQLRGRNYLSLAEVQVYALGDVVPIKVLRPDAGQQVCAVAKEHHSINLQCPKGQVVSSIQFASYGTPTGSCGAGFKQSRCHSTRSESRVGDHCLGKRSCIVTASNGIFRDPCRGAHKKLAVHALCQPNIAAGKHATQISTAYGGRPQRAVDGSIDGNYGHRSVTHTNSLEHAWWQVDLGGDYEVNAVSIFNRRDCCRTRLKRFTVTLRNSHDHVTWTKFVSHSPHFSTSLTVPPKAVGRYVKIRLQGKNYLSLAEVEVFAKSDKPNAKPPKPPAESNDVHFGDKMSLYSFHHRYVVAEANGRANANRKHKGTWETWTLMKNGDHNSRAAVHYGDEVALLSFHHRYLVSEYQGKAANANRRHQASWETFVLKNPQNPSDTGPLHYGSKLGLFTHFKKYIVAENNGQLNANRDKMATWETFQIQHGH